MLSQELGPEIAVEARVKLQGCRFFHPVWFVPEVDLTIEDSTNDKRLVSALEALGFSVSFYNPSSGPRRKLTAGSEECWS